MGLDVNVVRLVFIVATLVTGGSFAVGYVLAWLLVPADGADGNIASQAVTDRRGIAVAVGLGSLLVVVWIIANVLGAGGVRHLARPPGPCLPRLVLVLGKRPAAEAATVAAARRPPPFFAWGGGAGR